jgi:hypothetical protein
MSKKNGLMSEAVKTPSGVNLTILEIRIEVILDQLIDGQGDACSRTARVAVLLADLIRDVKDRDVSMDSCQRGMISFIERAADAAQEKAASRPASQAVRESGPEGGSTRS